VRATVVAGIMTIALAMQVVAASTATAGIYEGEFGGYYPTKPECVDARDRKAPKFSCSPQKDGTWMLLNYYVG
jgi:hypothetical protein